MFGEYAAEHNNPNQMSISFFSSRVLYFLVVKMSFLVNGHKRLNDGIDYMVDVSFIHE